MADAISKKIQLGCAIKTGMLPRLARSPCIAVPLIFAAAATGAAKGSNISAPPQQQTMTKIDCGDPGACREIVIKGDSEALLPNNMLAPFRGWGDPSIRQDQQTGDLWLSYSWLSTAVLPRPGNEPQLDFLVRTQLAKSVDQGRSFELVKVVNENTKAQHSTKNQKGWMSHEVSTLAQKSSGDWHLMWISYLDPFGPKKHGPAHLTYSSASTVAALGENARPWIRGSFDPPVADVRFDLSKINGLKNCITFTEPSLFAHRGEDYLAVNCIVVKWGRRRPELETLMLFKENNGEYALLGDLLDHHDAKAHGGERFEQGELTIARDGAILLLATPVIDDARHAGCYVFEVESLTPPRMKRDAEGKLVARALVVDSKSGKHGTGACSYDPHSETGLIVVRRDFDFTVKPIKILFSMMETGYHP